MENKEIRSKSREVLGILLDELKKEATKEPKNTINISALTEAINVLTMSSL